MNSTYSRQRARALATRLALLLGVAALAACSEQTMPLSPAVPGAPSFGVNNGGNNRRILFERNFAIYSMNADGSGVTQLTFPNVTAFETDASPAWSPDGKRIAFVRTSVSDPGGEIYVMNADGTGITQLTFSPGSDLSPTWSKDGKRIAFASTGGDSERNLVSSSALDIYIMDANTGGSVVRVTNQAGADTDPSWSPDGKQLAFVSWRDSDITGTSDLYAVTLDNMQVTRLTDAGVQVGSPSWAPGGKQIAFTAGDFEGGNTDIFVLTLDGLRLTRLTDGTATPGTDEAPSWSPDSKQIAFASTRASESREIYTMNADGKAVTRLTFNLVEDLNPAWNR